jgi:hypothetical protein
MPILLVEGERGAVPFIVDRKTPFVTENRNGISFTRIPGRFSICDSVNGNNRRYPRKVWEKNLAEGSALRESIKKSAAFGLLEHPADGKISLQSPICLLVTDAQLTESKDATGKPINEVIGEIMVVNTADGQKLKALIDTGYNPLVSSRGFGSVVKTSEGVDEVQDDYICEGWDCVLRPSFENAELWVPRENESQEEIKAKTHEKALAESSKGVNMWRVYQRFAYMNYGKPFGVLTDSEADDVIAKTGTLTPESIRELDQTFDVPKPVQEAKPAPAQAKVPDPAPPPPAPPPLSAPKSQVTETVMTHNEIKARIGQVRGIAIPKDPARFAEGMNEIAQLHEEVANFVAEDNKRSWRGMQLHEELSRIEKTWSESALAPSRTATRLNENYTKVLRVTKVLGEAAVKIRKKLSETLSQQAEAAQLVEELTERGQAWVAVADKRKTQLTDLNHKLDVACEALDIMRDRYNEDMTEMGRRVITLEFGEKAKPFEKALQDAQLPADIIAIREQLEGKKPGKAVQEEGKCPKCGKDKCECPKEEGKRQSKQESRQDNNPPPMAEHVLVPSARSITESVAIVQRLSASRLSEAERREQQQKAETAAAK